MREATSEEETMSVLEKLKALDEQRAKLLEDPKKKILEAAHQGDSRIK